MLVRVFAVVAVAVVIVAGCAAETHRGSVVQDVTGPAPLIETGPEPLPVADAATAVSDDPDVVAFLDDFRDMRAVVDAADPAVKKAFEDLLNRAARLGAEEGTRLLRAELHPLAVAVLSVSSERIAALERLEARTEYGADLIMARIAGERSTREAVAELDSALDDAPRVWDLVVAYGERVNGALKRLDEAGDALLARLPERHREAWIQLAARSGYEEGAVRDALSDTGQLDGPP